MQKIQRSVIESYRRVQAFLEAHPVEAPNTYAASSDTLAEVVARLSDHATWQEYGSRVSKSEKQQQQRIIREIRLHCLHPLCAAAKAAGVPGIQAIFSVPKDAGIERFLAAAKAMRDIAPAHMQVLAPHLPRPDLFERLTEQLTALEATIAPHARVVGTRVGAGAGIAQELRRGRTAVDTLDRTVRSVFAGNDVVLARWRTARRVRQLPSDGGLRLESSEAPVQLVPPPAKAA